MKLKLKLTWTRHMPTPLHALTSPSNSCVMWPLSVYGKKAASTIG